MDISVFIFLFFSVFLAFVVKGITGFANTLVMGALFSFKVPNQTTTPIDLLLSLPGNIWITWRERKHISPQNVIPLAALLFIGILPGVFFLTLADDWALRAGFGLVTLGMAIEIKLRQNNKPGKYHPALLVIIGLLSGLLAGLYGIGALLVAYISRTSKNRNQFRGDICCIFLLENIFRFGLYWATGILTQKILLLSLALAPAVFLGLAVGFMLDKHLSEQQILNLTVLLLAVSGISLFIKSVFQF